MERLSSIFVGCVLLGLVGSANANSWASLNAALGGRLHVAEPFARSCFSTYNGKSVAVNVKACDTLRTNYTNTFFRDSVAGAYTYLQTEACLSDPMDQCVLDASTVPVPSPSSQTPCNQGSIPDYYVEVNSASDVANVLSFAKKNNVPVSIKNSGHDFLTRSSQKGSIALWVHSLKGMTYSSRFTAVGCRNSVGRAITVATGETTGDVYIFAAAHNSTFIGGYWPTLAASGGWVQGGGHSVLSPVYGLGADRVVEFQVVTPDGVLRTANSCQNTDLFQALRGGGGGTFGIVLQATHRVEPAMPIAAAAIKLPSNITADIAIQWLKLTAQESLAWGKQGWGGHVYGTQIIHVNPLPGIANMNDGGAAATKSMNNAIQFALALGGTSVIEVLPDWLTFWNKYVIPGTSGGAGLSKIITSQLLPSKLFASADGVSSIIDYISTLRDMGLDPRNTYIPVTTPFVADTNFDYSNGRADTSVHPAYYEALWEFSNSGVTPWNSTYSDRLRTVTMLTNATRLGMKLGGSNGGTYVNEANPFTQNWEQAWWGSRYNNLVKTKKKYDPQGQLKCWKCIGFEDSDVSTTRFSCLGKLQQAVDHALSS